MITQLGYPDRRKTWINHRKKVCVCEEAWWKNKFTEGQSKKISCQITGHLSWAPSEVTCWNKDQTENINSSASGWHFSSHSKPKHTQKRI